MKTNDYSSLDNSALDNSSLDNSALDNSALDSSSLELKSLVIQGAREHNLKNIDLEIPKKKLVVFTGVSGSGKSSLAFDTIYAEGQRRYVESLSSYARQFLGQMEKPHYDYIRGLSPTIAIEQKAASKNPRSTVGTLTEIYDYLRVLFARVGVQYCYRCGRSIGAQSPEQIVAEVLRLPPRTKILLLAPLVRQRKGEFRDLLAEVQHSGFVRVRLDGEVVELSEIPALDKKKKHTIEVVVDRLIISDQIKERLTDSVETALRVGKGQLVVSCLREVTAQGEGDGRGERGEGSYGVTPKAEDTELTSLKEDRSQRASLRGDNGVTLRRR